MAYTSQGCIRNIIHCYDMRRKAILPHGLPRSAHGRALQGDQVYSGRVIRLGAQKPAHGRAMGQLENPGQREA